MLFLIDPYVMSLGGYGEWRLRPRFVVPMISETAKIFKDENIVDGQTGLDFRFYVAHYINDNGYSIFGYLTAPPSLCPNNTCPNDYSSLLSAMDTNTDVQRVRREWKADVVVFIHGRSSSNYSTGIANVPTSGIAYRFKDWANLIVKYQEYRTDGFEHEAMHVIGADHSVYNPDPGYSFNKAYINYFWDYDKIPSEKVGFRSFMAYPGVCQSVTGDSDCVWFKRLSSPSTYLDVYGHDERVRLGSSNANNKSHVINMLRFATNWSH